VDDARGRTMLILVSVCIKWVLVGCGGILDWGETGETREEDL
jgi:hypothetical protein